MARAWWVGGSLLLLVLLASCGSAVKTYAPDGKEAYIIQCRGGRYACAQQAGDLCGSRGYSTLDQFGQVMPPRTPIIGAPELMISCKDAPQAGVVYSGESRPPPSQSASKTLSEPCDKQDSPSLQC